MSLFARVCSFPLVRTSLFVVGASFIGAVGGLLLGLFVAGVNFLLLGRSIGLGSFAMTAASYLPLGMMFGALVTAILAGCAAVKTTPSGDEWFLDEEDDGFCETCGGDGCVCGPKEEFVVVDSQS